MAFLKPVLCPVVCLCAWIITAAVTEDVPKAENVHWTSLDFKTILRWESKAMMGYTYTVLYSRAGADWIEHIDCMQLSEMECDMTNLLRPFNRTYTADIQTEHVEMDYNHDPEELTHTYSPEFNPYKQSNISAANFTVHIVNKRTVAVNITDPLTGIHENNKQLSIRDVFRKDLKYKISYYKSGSTGKKDIVSDSSVTEVPNLDTEEGYCFMVAAFIPSRPKSTQLGAWSKQLCVTGPRTFLHELSVGVWVGAVAILLVVLVIIIAVTVLCCRWCRRKRNDQVETPQALVPR
ncbi:tissue factor-like [Cynoglossus semilaevis]|uniref:Tissue factor n=1 Tax=Cynoglossus semilaevis TaxID=244447 RepID=A0A3P8X099_CYNSE|nr:tissue factor-like [Cynoglossus semilaevis]